MSDHGPRQLLLLQQLQQLLAAAAAAAASLGLSNRALSACRTAAGRLAKLGPCSTYVRTCILHVQSCSAVLHCTASFVPEAWTQTAAKSPKCKYENFVEMRRREMQDQTQFVNFATSYKRNNNRVRSKHIKF